MLRMDMASNDKVSLSKIRKRLKLRQDKILVDTDTRVSSEQKSKHHARSPVGGLFRNGHSKSNKKCKAAQRRGENRKNGRKQATTTKTRLVGNETVSAELFLPPLSAPADGSDCIIISDNEVDVACSDSGYSLQFCGHSRSRIYDDTVKHEVVGTYASSHAFEQLQRRQAGDDVIALPDFANEDLPDLLQSSIESDTNLTSSHKRHIAPEALNSDSSSGEFVVVEKGTNEKYSRPLKRYLKTKSPGTKLSSSKCKITKHGKEAAVSCRRRIEPSATPSGMLIDLSNDDSSSDVIAASRSEHSKNIETTLFELSSSDEFMTPMHLKKPKASRKQIFKHRHLNEESSSDESTTTKSQNKRKDSQIKHRSSHSEAHLLSPDQSTENGDDDCEPFGIPGQVDQSDCSDSLAEVMQRKLEVVWNGAKNSVSQTSGDSDTFQGVPTLKSGHLHDRRMKDSITIDDTEQSNNVTCDPSASPLWTDGRCRSCSPIFASKLSRKRQDCDVASSLLMDIDQANVMLNDNSSVCSDIEPCNEQNTNNRLPLVVASSETVANHAKNCSDMAVRSARSLDKQTAVVSLMDIKLCKCADCSSIRRHFLEATVSSQDGNDAYNSGKWNSHISSRSVVSFVDDLTKTNADLMQCDSVATTSHCQPAEVAMNCTMSLAAAGDNTQERKDILNDLVTMCPETNQEIGGHRSDDDTQVGNVSTSRDHASDNDNNTEMVNVTKSGSDTSDSDDNDISDAIFSQQDDVISLLSECDADSVFANLSQLRIKSEPTLQSEQEMEKVDIIEILEEELGESCASLEEELGESKGALGRELIGSKVVLGKVIIPFKSVPRCNIQQDLIDAGLYFTDEEETEEDIHLLRGQTLTTVVKTEPIEEATKSGNLTIETVDSDLNHQTYKKVIPQELTKDVTLHREETSSKQDEDEAVGDEMQEHQEEQVTGDTGGCLGIRAAALNSNLQSLKKCFPMDKQHLSNSVNGSDTASQPRQLCQQVDTAIEWCHQGNTSNSVTKSHQSRDAVDVTTEPCQQSDASVTKPRQSHLTTDTAVEPCQQSNTSDTARKPYRTRRTDYTATKPSHLYNGACAMSEPWPVGETPDFSDDSMTTDDDAKSGSLEDNSTFLVLAKNQQLSSSAGSTNRPTDSKHVHRLRPSATPICTKTHLISPLKPRHLSPLRLQKFSPIRARHLSPIRARHLSPLKSAMFYSRRRAIIPPKKDILGRSSSIYSRLHSLASIRNRERRMASGKDVYMEQLSRRGVRNAQMQMKAREVLRKKNLARAKSASVPQRFTSQSDALLQDMTWATAKTPSSNRSQRTTTAQEHDALPAVKTSTADTELKNMSPSDQSVPPGREYSHHNKVAPSGVQKPNSTQQESVAKKASLMKSLIVVPPGGERPLQGVRMPVAQTKSSRTLSVETNMLLPILRWNPSWLSEQQLHCDKEPHVVDPRNVWPLLDSYDSFDQYAEIVTPLLLLETWQSPATLFQGISLDVELEVQQDWMAKRSGTERHMALVHAANIVRNKYIDLVYEGVLTREKEKSSRPIWKNDLLVLNLCVTDRDSQAVIKPVFAFVIDVNKFSPQSRKLSMQLLIAKDVKDINSVGIRICVRIAYRCCRIDEKKLMRVTIVSSLSTAVHQFLGLMSLPRSSLCRDILRPVNKDVFLLSLPDAAEQTSSQQLHQSVAHSAAKTALSPSNLPRICLIQGPPGTGKTTTIIDIISRILAEGQNDKKNSVTPKVLLCTPSNAAIDELARRLTRVKKKGTDGRPSPLQLVRVGAPTSMHENVSAYSLDELAKRRTQQLIKSNCPSSILRAMDSIRSKINALEQKYEIFLATSNEQEANKTKEERERQKVRLKKLEMSFATKTFSGNELTARKHVLVNADVVCCTLNSCGSNSMQHLIPTKSTGANLSLRMPHFTCIIIDEAAQCVELDCLIPLRFMCNKMILVGDQQQLPATVVSKKAMENNYNQSLFERFNNYFQVNCEVWPRTPIHVLDMQYRMHPQICFFPGQHFYNGQLKTDPRIKPRQEEFPYQPYLLFDVAYGQEQQESAGGITNKMEAHFVIELCNYLLCDVQPRNIGIITPYRKQTELIKNLYERGQDIDIGTVDGFQGREKDVIMVSCVRARNTAGTIGFLNDKRRMNVALTRAKYALYVIGRVSSLQVNSDWRKLIENSKQRRLVVRVNAASNVQKVIHEHCRK